MGGELRKAGGARTWGLVAQEGVWIALSLCAGESL